MKSATDKQINILLLIFQIQIRSQWKRTSKKLPKNLHFLTEIKNIFYHKHITYSNTHKCMGVCIIEQHLFIQGL